MRPVARPRRAVPVAPPIIGSQSTQASISEFLADTYVAGRYTPTDAELLTVIDDLMAADACRYRTQIAGLLTLAWKRAETIGKQAVLDRLHQVAQAEPKVQAEEGDAIPVPPEPPARVCRVATTPLFLGPPPQSRPRPPASQAPERARFTLA